MKIQNILKKHKIKVRGLTMELWKSDELNGAYKTITEYGHQISGLQTTVKALQAELDKQKARANGLAIELEEARKRQAIHADAVSEWDNKEEWLTNKVLVLKNRVEELEDICVSYSFTDIYKKQ